jgi:hypothetical protein
MFEFLFKSLFGSLISMITGWWSKRKETIALTRAQDNQAHADADAAVIITKTEVEIQHAREQTDAAVAAATADADDPDKLQRDVQRAIDAANSDDHVQ